AGTARIWLGGPVQGQAGPYPETATRPWPGLQFPSQRRGPFTHADDPLPASRIWVWQRSAAVVIDLDGEIPLGVGDAHDRGGRAGVPGHVRQRLLHDPVGRD